MKKPTFRFNIKYTMSVFGQILFLDASAIKISISAFVTNHKVTSTDESSLSISHKMDSVTQFYQGQQERLCSHFLT